ncbi:hypothetical protein [Rhodopirellula sp. P2]|uniref:hypothetical protein n=1 Tax=Rhodopirellula sp. P2 TaxID=2127060 RepID=UPI0023676EFE|nr:hypothetical protein [Rhodopirellula sp. P2]WDQ15445.1 hypothetical protein PSR62_17585 [Rhodopirellula sp. P2]
MKFSLRSVLVVVFLVALCCPFVVRHLQHKAKLTANMQEYAVACAITHYLSTHDLQWPENWEQLEPSFVAEVGNESPWSFRELQNRVSVRFDVDQSELIACSRVANVSVNFVGIKTPDDRVNIFQPNQFILDYVRFHLENADRE